MVEYTPSGVVLDGSASTDPDNDPLRYEWQGAGWKTEGPVVTVELGLGAYEIALTVADSSGHIDRDVIDVTVVADLDGEPQAGTTAVGAYPNPFNSSTQVFFELSSQMRVSLQIFDIQGRLVRTLEEGTFDQGRHERFWSGINDAGQTVASGPYFVRMRAGDRTELAKILLLK